MALLDVLGGISEWMQYAVLILLAGMGIILTIWLKGLQFTHLKEMFNVTFRPKDKTDKGISAFQAFCLSMGSRIGVGNISGPVLAILTGGPGAIFWMWVFALIGMVSSFVETTVGQIFKKRGEDGVCHGGPAYYVLHGIGLKRISMVIALIFALMYALGFISMEVDSMCLAFCTAFEFDNNKFVFALIVSILAVLVIVAGLKKIANFSSKIVPAMAIAWFVICFITIIIFHDGVVNGFLSIFEFAFSQPAVLGGAVGVIIMTGMTRGIMSNEAGIGTIPNISAMAEVSHPVKQGLSQAIGVLVDLIVCTLTALVVLSYGSFDEIYGIGLDSVPTLQEIFRSALGDVSVYLVALFMFIFAFTSLMSDIIIAENNLGFIKNDKRIKYGLYVFVVAVVFVSAFYASDELFTIVDIMLALCGIVNVLAMTQLAKYAIEAYRDYKKQKAEGVENPVFHKSALSKSDGVTEWD